MAAKKGETPGKTSRRVTGSGPNARRKPQPAQGTVAAKTVDVSDRSQSRGQAKESSKRGIEEEQRLATEKLTHIRCNSSMFQLRAQRTNLVNGYEDHVADWTLDFGSRGFITADEETVEAVEKVLDGQWSDGRVGGAVFQKLARRAGLEIIVHGLALPPIPTWDDLPPNRVVAVAFEAGALLNVQDVRKGIRYEKEAPERKPAREPREQVLKELEEVEAVIEARTNGGKVAAAVSNVVPTPEGISTPTVGL